MVKLITLEIGNSSWWKNKKYRREEAVEIRKLRLKNKKVKLLRKYRSDGSNTIFSSGSTEFGNSMSSSGFNDRHDVTGSISISGSYSLNNSNTIVEISNDTADDGGSQTALATEKVAYNSFGDQQPGFEFVRRKFAHTGSFVSSTTASFTAVTASTVTGLDAVTKHDFMFFNKGMIIEYDALDVQQSGSTFLMKVNPSSLGYGLDSNDEIVAWGKWND